MPEPGITQWGALYSPISFISRILFPGKATAGVPPPPSQRDITPVFLRDRFFGPTADITEASVSRAIAENEARIALEEEQQRANVLALRPAAQITREPVPVRVSLDGTNAPPGPTLSPPPETAPRPVQGANRSQLDEFARLYAMAFGFGNIADALGDFAGIVSNVRGIMGGGTQMVPTQFSALPPVVRGIGGAVGGGVVGAGVASLFAGGNGEPTALQRIKADAGRNITRRQIIAMARTCGLDQTASMLNTSMENVCELVSKGMPRRGRGISSRDMTRTRSTLNKLNTMQRSLSSLCPPARRRAPARRCK